MDGVLDPIYGDDLGAFRGGLTLSALPTGSYNPPGEKVDVHLWKR